MLSVIGYFVLSMLMASRATLSTHGSIWKRIYQFGCTVLSYSTGLCFATGAWLLLARGEEADGLGDLLDNFMAPILDDFPAFMVLSFTPPFLGVLMGHFIENGVNAKKKIEQQADPGKPTEYSKP